MRMAFFFDQSRCMGCNSCTVACKDYYDVNPGPVSYRKQWTHENLTMEGKFYSLVMSCNHCETPACMAACGAGAITKRNDGIVLVNRDKCQELKSCVTACPFAAPGIADSQQEHSGQDSWIVDHPMQKCSLCATLLDKDEQTVCMRACPVHAIDVGDYGELLRRYAGAMPLSIDKFPYAYEGTNPNTNTGPSLLIKPRKAFEIHGNNNG